MELLETFQCFEKWLTSIGCIVTWTASNHTQVWPKTDCIFHSVEIRPKWNSSLLSDFIIIEVFVWLWRFLENFSLIFKTNQSVFEFLLQRRNIIDAQLKNLSIVGRQVAVSVSLESNQLWHHINLVLKWWKPN